MTIQSALSIAPFDLTSLIIAAICGVVMGLERQLFGKPAGMRTCALITLSTYFFVALGTLLSGDQLRIIGQIVTGVGFIGGGLIISKEGIIQGMTSAATIWLLSAIGSVIGSGYPFLGLKLTFFCMIILWLLNIVESKSRPLQKGVHRIRRNAKRSASS
jgi:putative Mg2+ transporter-C (MgtC) family protein